MGTLLDLIHREGCGAGATSTQTVSKENDDMPGLMDNREARHQSWSFIGLVPDSLHLVTPGPGALRRVAMAAGLPHGAAPVTPPSDRPLAL